MLCGRRRDSVLAHCLAARLPVERAAATVPISAASVASPAKNQESVPETGLVRLLVCSQMDRLLKF
jgi:hypothetical protein